VIVHLALLMLAKRHNCPVSALSRLLPARFTASGRDQSFATAQSRALLTSLAGLTLTQLATRCALGEVTGVDQTDGLRISFASQEVLHLRPSGNAPELRCYAEASSEARAEQLVVHGLTLARQLS
jgi:phosphomannomutase